MTSILKADLLDEIGRRFKAQFWFKTFGSIGFMALFFWGYIYILQHAFVLVTEMPLLAVDRLIPYQNGAWLIYVSLWVYVQLPVTMIVNRRELVRYGWSSSVISIIGFAVFIFWPTAVPLVDVDGVGTLYSAMRNIDTTGNSCPSLHVAFSVFTAMWLDRFVRWIGGAGWVRWFNVIWCLSIVYSTMATKQHVLIDVVAGGALGYAGGWVQARFGGEVREMAAAPDFAQIKPASRKL